MSEAGLFKTYYFLTKPGIIQGNAITAAAGFFLASHGKVNTGLFIAMLSGLSFIIASGCVLNNFIDRNIDRRMDRTKNRALVTGRISAKNAVLYAAALAVIGSIILAGLWQLLI